MKSLLCALLLMGWAAWADVPAVDWRVTENAFRWVRPVVMAPTGPRAEGEPATACAVLDASVFAHAEPSLSDLRVFAQGSTVKEVPFALTSSESLPMGDRAELVNLGMVGKRVSFDLQMPARAYTQVDLELTGRDFLATATVTGLSELPGPNARNARPVALGSYTLFDLSSQNLGRSTSFTLQEARFPFLHVELAVAAAVGHSFDVEAAMVRGAEIPPSREAQTIYTEVAETTAIAQRGRETVASFMVPARVPIEQVEFELVPGTKINFSRAIRVRASVAETRKLDDGRVAEPLTEEVSGNISRVRVTEAGKEIRVESLAIPATLGSNARGPATVEVAVENGDDQPIPLKAVRLSMRQRKLCLDQPANGAAVNLFYGGEKIAPPVYDYVRLFDPLAKTRTASLGAETANPAYVAPVVVDERSFADRHPAVLWVALLAAIAALGAVAFRSAKRVGS